MIAFILLIASIFLAVFTASAQRGGLIKNHWVIRGLIVLSGAMFLGAILPTLLLMPKCYGPREYTRVTTIRSLEEDRSLPGHFVLGVGSDQGEKRYFFLTEDGKTGSGKATAQLVVETDSTDAYIENKTIVIGTYKDIPEWKRRFVMVEFLEAFPPGVPRSFSSESIHVPLGTLLKEYNPEQ